MRIVTGEVSEAEKRLKKDQKKPFVAESKA